jgi:hypothetical protein
MRDIMNRVRLILTVITIAINVTPVAGVLLMYQNNLLGLIIPPGISTLTNESFITEGSLGNPIFVDSRYDAVSRTAILTFEFTNTLQFDLTINSMSAEVQCDTHDFPLGHATLNNIVSIGAGETATIDAVVIWTQEAISHFQTAHAGAQSIDVELVGLSVCTNGINVQTGEHVKIPNCPIK